MSVFSSNKVDEAMQEFASKCCQHNAAQPPATACIMNADGIYLATYAALLLTLRLRRTNCYTEPPVNFQARAINCSALSRYMVDRTELAILSVRINYEMYVTTHA